jgi:alkylhydroperoxidase/carboxymuconolactone decarboxylase family protein YurZ
VRFLTINAKTTTTTIPKTREDSNMSDETNTPEELPSTAGELAEEFPDVWDSYAGLGKACSNAGPIDDETKRLVKLALAVGSQSEGAVHSHVRQGLEEDIDPETLRHVALLSVPTIGFPKAVAALTWIDDLAD